jgi:trehalose utilization protein
MHVTVWGEFVQEREEEDVRAIYPEGMHETIAAALRPRLSAGTVVRTASLDQPDHGLSPAALATTDVLIWQAHLHHHIVRDEVAERVIRRVLDGMGLVVLHSAMDSKPFQRLMGTSCHASRWRQGDDREVVWTVNPSHPITAGLPPVFVIPKEEMYSEYFDIPQPDDLVFISSFSGGEVFRSGCCFSRGKGRIFYFRPGHETHPIYHQPEVQQVLANAVRWAHVEVPSGLDLRVTDPMEREGPSDWYAA